MPTYLSSFLFLFRNRKIPAQTGAEFFCLQQCFFTTILEVYHNFFLFATLDNDIFRRSSCLSCHNIFNLRTLGIRQCFRIYHHIHAAVADAYHHIRKSFCFQENLCRRLLFRYVCKLYHPFNSALLLFLRDTGTVDNIQQCFLVLGPGLFFHQFCA